MRRQAPSFIPLIAVVLAEGCASVAHQPAHLNATPIAVSTPTCRSAATPSLQLTMRGRLQTPQHPRDAPKYVFGDKAVEAMQIDGGVDTFRPSHGVLRQPCNNKAGRRTAATQQR